MKGINLLQLFLTVVFFVMLPSLISGQVFYAHGDSKLVELNEENASQLLGNAKTYELILKAYTKQIKKQQIVVPDSAFIVFETNIQGEIIAISQRGGFVRKYIDILEKSISKESVQGQGLHKIALVFKPLDVHSYSIWDADEVPILVSCKRLNSDGNAVYFRSCFNYSVESRIRDLEKPSPKKRELLKGKIKARITISPEGLVSMMKFDSSSQNPDANEFFMYQLYLVPFPKGVKQNGDAASYHIDVDFGYFIDSVDNSYETDTTFEYEVSYLLYDHKTGKTTLLENEILDSTLQSMLDMDKYKVGDSKIPLWDNTQKVVIGASISLNVSQPKNLIYSGVAVVTPTYFGNREIDVFPSHYSECGNNPNALYASTCTSQRIIEHTQENFSYLRWVDSWPGTVSQQVLLFDEKGNLIRQQITKGSFYAQFDLECMSALSSLPQLKPARLNGKNSPSLITITAILR